ncbi:MAG TPA: exonuclease subunit SbcD [Chitinophagales bacterium]|nr:exonuclease subunit SbcD [Chitinophagales bacterium]
MKLLHTADWHLGKRLDRFSRLDEQRDAMEELCRIADDHDVDCVLIAGDVYDSPNPPDDAEDLFYKTVHRLSRNGKRAVVVIAGNHDSPRGLETSDPLARECGIFLVGYPDTVVECCKTTDGVEVLRADKGFIELALAGCAYPLRLLVTPYANEQRLKTFLGTNDGDEELRQLLQTRWQTLSDKYCDAAGVNVLMAHLYITKKGVELEEPDDERPIRIGNAQAIYTENLPTKIQYAALGHLHNYIPVDKEPCPVVYSSSPLKYTFDKGPLEKYCMVVTAEPGKPVVTERIELLSGKKLFHQKFESVDEAIVWLEKYQDAWVMLTIVTDDFLTEQDRRRLQAAHQGIVDIIPESRNILTSGASVAQIDLSQDMETLFTQFFLHKHGQAPNEDLISLFKEVLSEGRND